MRLAYQGLDDRTYETQLTFSPAPTELRSSSLLYRAHVPALGRSSLHVRVTARVRGQGKEGEGMLVESVPAPEAQLDRARRSYQDWLQAATALESDNALFDAAIARSLLDLRLLLSRLDDRWFFGAGIPWFAALFGRDSLVTGLQTLAWNPDLAAGILRLLAGATDDAWRDEEPGKILHELRTGELARTGRVPHAPYYGTIDATPLFLLLAAAYYDWTGDLGLLREIRPNLESALRWCLESGDIDGDGYLDYARRSAKGLANQGWKDSGEGIMFANGRLPRPPIALVEVQGYLYAAYRGLARLLRLVDPGQEARPRELEARAARLRDNFNQDFWMAGPSFYALGLDGAKHQIDAISSNPGPGTSSTGRGGVLAARRLARVLAAAVSGRRRGAASRGGGAPAAHRCQHRLLWASAPALYAFAVALKDRVGPPAELARWLLAKLVTLIITVLTIAILSRLACAQTIACFGDGVGPDPLASAAPRQQPLLDVVTAVEQDRRDAGEKGELRSRRPGPCPRIADRTPQLRAPS